MLKFISKQWRGDAPFWLSVLVISLLLPWIVILGGLSWLGDFTIGQTPSNSMLTAALLFALIAAVSVWQLIGTWRATAKTKAPSRSWFTRWTGRAVALSSLALALFAFAGLPGNMASYYAEATDADWIGQQEHSVTVDGDTIVITGFMSWGLHDEFVAALRDNPGVTNVVLDSPGGHYAVGLRLGDMIRAGNLDTSTTSMCGSACIFAFMGGSHRTLGEGAKLGFHAMAGNTQVALDRLQAHAANLLQGAGVPEEFITRIFATPADDVWYPTVRELRQANVITDVEG
ncbi:Clp protease [Hyphomicrobium sp. 1Nfss2.1]|uniref:COG3904 family protein n=1 Tax=Hyphomicrobium sp. 1Nfss2.1 TaxID=3413936 RepID=UPI003C7E0EE2